MYLQKDIQFVISEKTGPILYYINIFYQVWKVPEGNQNFIIHIAYNFINFNSTYLIP